MPDDCQTTEVAALRAEVEDLCRRIVDTGAEVVRRGDELRRLEGEVERLTRERDGAIDVVKWWALYVDAANRTEPNPLDVGWAQCMCGDRSCLICATLRLAGETREEQGDADA